MANVVDRRFFHKAGALGVASVVGMAGSQLSGAQGSNNRIRIGVIGVGKRGGQLINAILEHQDAQIVAICDVYQPHLEKAQALLPARVDHYDDFRKIIDRADIDAVVIATPDHWHAIQCILACESGKDVYVEKPLSVTIVEGRKMVQAARKNQRVVQVGTHRRSAAIWKEAAEMVQEKKIGQVTVSRAARITNMYPNGIGKLPSSNPPAGLNWDMWLGPREAIPYQANIAPYKFRWWQNYSSQMGNWGVHYFDAIRWCLNQRAPKSVCAMGGQYVVDDDRTIPDTAQAMFEFSSGHLLLFSTLESSGNPLLPPGAEVELRGTDGTLYVGGKKLKVLPERGGQFQDHRPRMKPLEKKFVGGNSQQTSAHFRNFFDCMRSRGLPDADVEAGHLSTSMALLANISLATKSRLDWDSQNEKILNLPKANHLLHYEYRSPWKL